MRRGNTTTRTLGSRATVNHARTTRASYGRITNYVTAQWSRPSNSSTPPPPAHERVPTLVTLDSMVSVGSSAETGLVSGGSALSGADKLASHVSGPPWTPASMASMEVRTPAS